MAGMAVLVVAAVVAYFAIYGFPVLEKPGGKEPPKAPPIHESKEFNYRFVFPESAWKQDNQTRVNVKANLLAVKRSNPNAWFTLAARDFKSRTPDKQEVIDEAVKRLEGYFQELEWDPAPDGFLAQRSAWVFVFQAKADNTLMRGECHILKNKSMVYWFTTWCAAKDAPQLASEWPKIREGFSLLANKED
ncbi:MAG TPA: hypothetical protein VGY77_07910 [Gemmataceae bacterium]|nr:hypothetical protein [Gemmataceae bacterium]